MKYLKQFIHPQWGSVVGSEKEIRLAVLQDEIEIWEQRLKNDHDSIPYLEYIRDTLKSRIEELQPSIIIQEHEMTWGNEYE